MKKQRRQMIALLLLLAMLVGGFFGLKQYNKLQSEMPAEVEEDKIIVADLELNDIVKFSYDYRDDTYEFVREEGTWFYTEDRSLNLKQSTVSVIALKVCPMEAKQVIGNVTDMTQYGLDEPSKILYFETATGSETLYVGDYNSMSQVYYVCKPSENLVYTVEEHYVTVFDYAIEDLVEEEVTET